LIRGQIEIEKLAIGQLALERRITQAPEERMVGHDRIDPNSHVVRKA
jgi:hypothetical protein